MNMHTRTCWEQRTGQLPQQEVSEDRRETHTVILMFC